MKTKTSILILLLLLSASPVSVVKHVTAQESGGGPRVDNLLIKIYSNYNAAVQAFEAGQIDFFDSPLNSTLKNKYSTLPWNSTISLDPVSELAMYQIDINNNYTIPSYPSWSSPTSFQAFRHGIAHIADKSEYVNSILGGYGTILNTPVMPWMTEWHNQFADPHAFNRTEAALILDAGGFADANGDGIRDYPSAHEKAGENLDPLVFFSPVEDPDRIAVAESLTSEMLLIGIPVNLRVTDWSNTFSKVIEDRDFHLYIGKQDMYHSDVSADTAATGFSNIYSLDALGPYGANYVHFNNTQFTNFAEMLQSASDNATKTTTAKEAQRVLAEQVGIIPLFAKAGYKAHTNTWTNVVNEDGNGVDNWWTFLMTHQENQSTGATLTYGITGDPNGLNPLFTHSSTQQLITDLIYQSLLRVRDLGLPVSGIASNWTTDTWLNPDTGSIATKVVYHLNNNIHFHDGVQLTAEDVKFTIEYMKIHKIAYNYARVANVHHVDAPDAYTVVVYENTINTWALQWIGSIPITPKHKWQSIVNPNASMPEPTMTGTGPFKFVEYLQDDHLLLTANRNFVLPVSGDANGDGTVNAQDLVLLSYSYGSVPEMQHWNPSCDFNGDGKVDDLDLYRIGRNYGNG
jgi:peptide/nickel transport system substrate-binding protein